jgi:hypothetical protein
MLLFISPKNILFILGVILLLRFIGKMMSARRNISEQDKHSRNEAKTKFDKEKSNQNIGKTSIHKIDKNKVSKDDYTEFEEID